MVNLKLLEEEMVYPSGFQATYEFIETKMEEFQRVVKPQKTDRNDNITELIDQLFRDVLTNIWSEEEEWH